ncbi:MAG: SRPBCC family protein [Saprospiraceae bacterium]|nr:SRPBCC family protein [Saprospiraceae bacterium]
MNAKIDKTIIVNHPINTVWELLINPEKIVSCVPGASLTSKESDTEYKGQVEFKMGPVKAKYDGLVTFLTRDAETKKLSLKGLGLESKGKGNAEMQMDAALNEVDAGTEISLTMDINVSGMMAQFGSRLINDVSNQLLDQFGKNLEAQLAGGEVDKDVHTGSIIGSVVKGLFK